MGVRISSSVFVLLFVYYFLKSVGHVRADNICNLPGCRCTKKAAQWQNLNCTLKKDQDLNLTQHNIPREVTEIFIDTVNKITFQPKSIHLFKGLTLVEIRDAALIDIEKTSFQNSTSPSLLVRIQGCHHLRILNEAFQNVQALQIEVDGCDVVNVANSFSALSLAHFKNIKSLNLAEKAFDLKDATIGPHGPVTRLIFDAVKILSLPSEAFHSYVAEITLINSEIDLIKSRAFSAAEIPSILLQNCKINAIESDAFNSATLIFTLKINNCTIGIIHTRAIMAAINNLTVQYSIITEIHTGAINNTAANIKIKGNQIFRFFTKSLSIQQWNSILIENNIIRTLDSDFIVAANHPEKVQVKFISNEVYNLERGALSFLSEVPDDTLIFQNNLFNQSCHCFINDSYQELIMTNSSTKIQQMIETSFCMVNDFISQCFALPVGAINAKNFTELICKKRVICEPYQGEVKVVNATGPIFAEIEPKLTRNWITIIMIATAILLFLAIASFIIILIRGGRWLKRKRCFRNSNIEYQNQETSQDEETIETVNEKPDDLTLELLQNLSQKLDDPSTHQEASEMIEQLYQQYIRETAENNNEGQDNEDAHLYEELGNLQLNYQQNVQVTEPIETNGPRSILRLMEEKFNTQFEDIDADDATAIIEEQPSSLSIVGEYSEPSDAAVHLYSELKTQNGDNSDSLKSKASTNMASRPLPDKPGSSKN